MSSSAQPDEYPEILQDLAAHIAHHLVGEGIPAERAAHLGQETAEHVREHWGGQKIYIPKGLQYELNQRDIEIWNQWNGRNMHVLCNQFGLTEIRIYQILKQVRDEIRRRNQPDLFGIEGK